MANRNGNHFWNQLLQSAEPVASAVMAVAGAVLGAASAALQISVFSALIGGGWISTLIVLAFEATKASTAVVQTSGRHRGKTRVLRVGLFMLSFVATLFYVSAQLTAPNLEEVTEEEIESVNTRFSERIEAVRDRYAPQIARYDSLKRAERNDTYADGTYTGPQFQEFKRLKNELIAERDAKVQELKDRRETEIREIRQDPPSDRRVQNEKVASLIRLAHDAFGIEIKNAWVALFVASVVALLLELAIFKLFAEIGELSRKARKAARRRRRETPSPAGPASGEPAGAAGAGATTAGAASGKAGIDTPGGHEAEEGHEAEDRREAEDREAKASSPGSKKARRNGKADRSSSGGSSTLYSWMGGMLSLAPALALLVFLEGGTPVAPVQRVVGNTLNALPPAGLRLVMGEEDARRYMHPERHIAAQEQQGVLGGGGAMLARPTANPEFPKTLRRALVRTENHRFWDRYAVDWWSTGRATVATAKAKIFGGSGGGLEGGSGLTQQLAGSVVLKNSELMKAGFLPGIAGKLWEAAVSSGMIDRLSREKVLNLYLRGVYLGRGSDGPIKGFAEAAWTYFHRPVDELTDAQIVALVSILPGPNGFVANDDRFERRYETVVGWLRKGNVFTPAESEALLQNRPALRVQVDEQYQRVHDATTHARDYLGERVADSLGTVRSTISASASVGARRIFMDMIRDLENRTGNGRLEGFVLVAEQGKLRAMIGSTSLTGHNRAVEEFAPWSPGSTMKPYAYTEFFAQGGAPADRLSVRSPKTFALPGGETWKVENYSHRYDTHPPMRADRALANSINVAAASLTVGPVGESLRRRLAGVGYGDFAGHPSDVLGSRGVRPLRHFRLLQAFARPYGEIPEEGFALRRTEEVNRREVWPQAAARKTARAMGRAVTEGTLSGGRRCCGWSARTHRGKTGTGQNHKAATLYVSRSGGVTVLMGVYSLGGARLTYQGRAGSVAGGSLVPYADRILQLSALRQTRGGSFDAIADL